MAGLLWDVVVLCMPVCWTMRGVLYISTGTRRSFARRTLVTVTLSSHSKTGHFLPLHTALLHSEDGGKRQKLSFRCADEYTYEASQKSSFFPHWRARGEGICVLASEGERKSVQRATATEWCQCNLSIVSCLLSCSKLWSVSIDQRKNLLPLTFDSSIDHFLLYTVKGKYSDSTRGLGRSPVITLLIFKGHFPYASYHTLRYEGSDCSFCAMNFTIESTNTVSKLNFLRRCPTVLFYQTQWWI